jgi:hypothetical protein
LPKGLEKTDYLQVKLNLYLDKDDISFNGIPEDVELFEVFWEQITNLISVKCFLIIRLDLNLV